MPLIEELPTTTAARISHGWAYVPDTGPAKAILPPGSRKRGAARDGAANRADGSAKQAKIAQARLADLDKENYKDTTIPIPPRAKDKGKKITPNVRRILMYQRTFAHYLADEEAQLAQSGGPNTPAATTTTAIKPTLPRTTATVVGAAAGPSTRTPSRAQQSPMAPPPRPRTASTSTPSNLKRETSSVDPPASTSKTRQSPKSAAPTPQRPSSIGGSAALLPVNPTLDNDPLLKSQTPKMPSARVMEALLSEPPLTYNAARAKPSDDSAPVRHFCAICGYWGKVKCRKCGERTCGLMECWRGHEAGCTPY